MRHLSSLKHTQLSPLQNLCTVPFWQSTLIWHYLPILPSSQDVTMFSSKIRTRPFELQRTASLGTVVTEAPENLSRCEFRLTHCGLGLETFLAFCFLSDSSRHGAQRALGTGCLSSLHQALKIFPGLRVCSASSAAATCPWCGPRIYESSALFTSERVTTAKGNGRIYLFDTDLLTLRVRKENLLSSQQKATVSQSMAGTEMKPPGYKY